jgi:hypothetical protein
MPAAIVAAASTAIGHRRCLNHGRLASRLAAVIAVEQPTTAATVEEAGLGLGLQGELGDPRHRHAQHQSNQVALHRKSSKKTAETWTNSGGARKSPTPSSAKSTKTELLTESTRHPDISG